jgi:hypothetical protein
MTAGSVGRGRADYYAASEIDVYYAQPLTMAARSYLLFMLTNGVPAIANFIRLH